MTGRFATPGSEIRATTEQRKYVHSLLKRHHYLGWGRAGSERTGPTWRPLFKAVGNEPDIHPGTGETDWPTGDEFVDSLTCVQASKLINHLLGDK